MAPCCNAMAAIMNACTKFPFLRISGLVNVKLINHGRCLCRHKSKIVLDKHRAVRESEENDDNDFFGIIRGDGVKDAIHLEENKIDPFKKYDRLMRGPEPNEKIFITSFGSIRFDADNQPGAEKHHGLTSKLEMENEDEITAAKRTEKRIKKEKEVVGTRRRTDEELSGKDCQIASSASENYVDELYFGKAVMDVDQAENMQIRETKQRDSKRCDIIASVEEGNYVDRVYFGNVENDERENVDFGELKNDAVVDFVEAKNDRNLEFGRQKNVDFGIVNETNVVGMEIKELSEEKSKGMSEKVEKSKEKLRRKLEKEKAGVKSERNSIELVNKYEPLERETAEEFIEKSKRHKNEKKMETAGNVNKMETAENVNKMETTGNVVSQVVNIYKEPEYVVLEMLTNSVIYNDNEIVAINKPYGLPCQDGPKCHHTLLKFLPQLAEFLNENLKTLYPVHRLDINTTGVLLLAKTEKMADCLKSLFKQHKMHKTYYAITKRTPDPPQGIINIPIAEGNISGRRRMILKPDYNEITKTILSKSSVPCHEAKTEYKVISTCDNASLVELNTRTGVTHQVRVHLGFGLGCPVLGDHKYTSITKLVPQKLPDDMLKKLNVRQSKVRDLPLHLHARSISIPEIVEGRNIFIRADLPKHFLWALKKLKLGSKRNRTD